MQPWRLLLHPDLPGYRQMAIDEALYSCLTPLSLPVIRFYSWQRPTLSLGYFQDYEKVVCRSFCMHNKIHVVRRITGGRAVLHDMEVTYAVVAPLQGMFAGESLQDTYRSIAGALSLGLIKLGIQNTFISQALPSESPAGRQMRAQCFVSTSRYELSAGARKIIGSAQKRGHDRFLQHGSILLGFNRELQQGCVNHSDPGISSKVASITSLLGREVQFSEITPVFAQAFSEHFGAVLQHSELSPDEQQKVQELETKYQSADWTERICR